MKIKVSVFLFWLKFTEELDAFENVNFFYPTEDEVEKKVIKREPPPIPARRQSHQSSTSSTEIKVTVPTLPAPPRRDSRKGRKRPNFLESSVGAKIFPPEHRRKIRLLNVVLKTF